MRQENARAQVAMPGDAKIRNRQMMLRAICSGQAVTAADIHQSTGISRPTAMRFLQHLCQCGAVAPVGFGESTRAGGKKPELFRFSDQRRILCVNLWPETITLALSGLVGPVYDLEENARRLPPCLDGDLARAKALAQAYLARRGLSLEGLYGVALTVPGTVDYAAQGGAGELIKKYFDDLARRIIICQRRYGRIPRILR